MFGHIIYNQASPRAGKELLEESIIRSPNESEYPVLQFDAQSFMDGGPGSK